MAHIVGNSHCLRCNSRNVKFRYYNNKNINEPRYWCNNCNKYYTHGGKIRKPPKIVGTRNPPTPPVAMEAAPGCCHPEEAAYEDEVGEARVKDKNNNESEASIENTEDEANGAHISTREPHELKLMPTLGALRTQRRKGEAPVKALLK